MKPKYMETSDGVLLDSDTSLRIARITRIASFITFFTFWPYKSRNLNFLERQESDDMLSLKDGYVESFLYYTQQVHLPYFEFSIDFIDYLQLVDGFDDYDFWCEKFLTEYYDGDIDDDHKKRFLSKIKILHKNNVAIYDVVDFEDDRLAYEAITKFNSIFCVKRTDPLKEKKWKTIKIYAGLLIFVAVGLYNLLN